MPLFDISTYKHLVVQRLLPDFTFKNDEKARDTTRLLRNKNPPCHKGMGEI